MEQVKIELTPSNFSRAQHNVTEPTLYAHQRGFFRLIFYGQNAKGLELASI